MRVDRRMGGTRGEVGAGLGGGLVGLGGGIGEAGGRITSDGGGGGGGGGGHAVWLEPGLGEVVEAYFDNGACAIPFGGVLSNLVLYPYSVTDA